MIPNIHFDPKFTTWLHENKYTYTYIKMVCARAFYYTSWLKNNHSNLQKATYKDLMDYVGYLKDVEQKTKNTINEHLRGIEIYYRYLELPNIAFKVRVRGHQEQIPLLLNEEELKKIYEHYDGYLQGSHLRYSNKILVGLFIYQAVDITELQRIELHDVDLEKGTIYLPAGARIKNSRIVNLEVHQIIALHEYITKYRTKKTKYKQHQYTSDLLFTPQAEKKHRLMTQCKYISKHLKIQTKELEVNYQSLRQLRQSRISIWIKQYGIRQAQYLSGRRKAHTIERYRKLDLEDLSDKIQKFHPLQ